MIGRIIILFCFVQICALFLTEQKISSAGDWLAELHICHIVSRFHSENWV